MLFLVTQRDELCPADQCLSYHADGQSHLNGAAMTVDRREQTSPVPLRTSPAGLETYIAGRTLVSGDGPAWTDLFVQVFSLEGATTLSCSGGRRASHCLGNLRPGMCGGT